MMHFDYFGEFLDKEDIKDSFAKNFKTKSDYFFVGVIVGFLLLGLLMVILTHI